MANGVRLGIAHTEKEKASDVLKEANFPKNSACYSIDEVLFLLLF